MPKTAAVDAGHGVFTDHAILRNPSRASKAAGEMQVRPFLGVADDRAWGIAYAEAGDRRAGAYLTRAQPADAEVLLRLAVMEKDPRRAASLYESVLRKQPANAPALVNLGVLHAKAGHPAEAAKLWQR